ncbi:right-handed parallel beta-helix repeat-containing protein [Ferruginibacter sp.]|uniref:right-handed parallel beta-helix repeat-containing protein n=1 Tax=Ferruginibacter sp. TaxID=1940288 RepID=UPI00374D6D35
MILESTFIQRTSYRLIILRYSIVMLAFLVNGISGKANSYYISSSSGSDFYSSAQAQNSSTPWQSINKLNSFFSNLVPGDNVFFKRGDTFYGSVVVTRSGASGNPIVLGAYGTGNNPVITGLTSLTSWNSIGNGIFVAPALGAKNSVNLVTLNGKPQQIGRFPNADAANGGYLTYETYTNLNEITDNQLSSSPNWTGAEVCIRKQHFLLERCLITNHSGNNIFYTPTTPINPADGNASVGAPTNGFGYFIQRDARTLDQQGEWYLDPVTKNLKIYLGANNPSMYDIRISTLDTLVNLNNSNYINISGLTFEGANLAAVYSKDGGNIIIQNCSITSSGAKGLFIFNCPNILVDNVNCNYALSNGIDITDRLTQNATVTNSNISNTGIYPGMGSNWNACDYKGICVDVSSTALIQYNNVTTTGYTGIHWQGNNVAVKNNLVNYYNYVVEDGGGIYTFSTNGQTYTGRVVRDNIVVNGIGAPAGTGGDVNVQGIYLDGVTMNVDVLNNSVANVASNGYYMNNPTNVKIDGNTSFNNGGAIGVSKYFDGPVLTNFSITNNVFYPKLPNQYSFFYANTGLDYPYPISIQTAMQQMGTIDNNYLNQPNAAGYGYYYKPTAAGSYTFPPPMTFAGWKAATGHDMASKLPPVSIPSYTLNGLTSGNTITNGQFTSDISSTGFFADNGNNTSSWNNSGKIGSGGSLVLTPGFSTGSFTFVSKTAGAVTAGQRYIVRFSTVGSTENGLVNAVIRQTNGSYASISDTLSHTFGTVQVDHEFLLTASASESNATLQLEFQQTSGATYIKNIQFYSANATPIDINSVLRFEYNATKAATTVALDANYIGVDGSQYNGSVTLQPYTSKVLIKNGASIVATTPLTVTSSAGPVACFGGTVNVIINAAGGVAPYTGTGNFSVGAGQQTFAVKDAAGNTATTDIFITQPASPLQIQVNAGTIANTGGATTVTVSATGGTAPYSGTGSFLGLAAGTYTYSVRDANGCTATSSVTITTAPLIVVLPVVAPPVVAPPVIAIPVVNNGNSVVNGGSPYGTLQTTATASAIRCFGDASSVTITGTGGTAPLSTVGTYNLYAGTGTLKVDFPAAVDNYTSIYTSIGAVSSSKYYVLYFSTLGTTQQGLLRVYIGGSNKILSNEPSASFGKSRVDQQFIFTLSDNSPTANVEIELNQNSGTTYIDNIAVFECTATGTLIGANLINGGQFESGIDNFTVWSPNQNHLASWDQTAKISNIHYVTTYDAASLTSTTVIALNQPTKLQALSHALPIGSAGGFTTIGVDGIGGTAPYTGTGWFYVSAGNYTYVITDANGCSASTTYTTIQADARIAVGLTAAASVTLIQPPSTSTTLSVTTFPNPATSEFGLLVQGGTNEPVEITITSSDGKVLLKRKGTSNQKYHFGNDYLPGMYFIQVIQGRNIKTLKAIKTRSS